MIRVRHSCRATLAPAPAPPISAGATADDLAALPSFPEQPLPPAPLPHPPARAQLALAAPPPPPTPLVPCGNPPALLHPHTPTAHPTPPSPQALANQKEIWLALGLVTLGIYSIPVSDKTRAESKFCNPKHH